MEPDRTLLILAMEHRESLQHDIYGIEGEPRATDVERIAAGKKLVFDGLLHALRHGIDPGIVGVLVDERYGAAVARRVRDAGLSLAMPVERSGQQTFVLEYGTPEQSTWLEHVRAFDPDQVKVLVRDNPDDPADSRLLQFERLARVSAALDAEGRVLLVELLVPATDRQLADVGGDVLRYDTELRPDLTVRVVESMYAAGVEPQIWKIEGLETRAAAEQIVAAAQAGGRSGVRCIVLGRDAPEDRLDHWLQVAAPVPGFVGFAIGRSIWEAPLMEHEAGRLGADEAVRRIAKNYVHFANAFIAARSTTA
jgi:myo-inositol catabolism protein IolC